MSLSQRLALLLVLCLSPAACGESKKNDRGRGEREPPTPQAAVPPPSESPKPPPADPEDGVPPPVPTPPEFDEEAKRSAGLHYYQWDARLKDLFSPTTAVSQLCWPAALAAEMEWQRTKGDGALKALPELRRGPTKETDETRYFAGLCETDRETGTTVIQGVRCIDKHIKAAELSPSIHVGGIDAEWDRIGFFPDSVESTEGPIRLESLRRDVAAGKSVFLLVGFYSRDRSGALKRERGHFVAVTGFGYKNVWTDERQKLRIMNPAVEPSGSAASDVYEAVELSKTPAGEKVPTGVAYLLIGDGFSDGSLKAYVESSISFSATR